MTSSLILLDYCDKCKTVTNDTRYRVDISRKEDPVPNDFITIATNDTNMILSMIFIKNLTITATNSPNNMIHLIGHKRSQHKLPYSLQLLLLAPAI